MNAEMTEQKNIDDSGNNNNCIYSTTVCAVGVDDMNG